MDILTTYFPFSFKLKHNLAALVINIAIHLIVGLLAGLLFKLVSWVPVINVIVWLTGSVFELYLLAGIVLSVLDYLNILK